MNRARSRLAQLALLGLAALVALGATPIAAPPQAPDASGDDAVAAQRAFFENLRAFCGQTFGGRTIFAEPDDRTFEPARLYMADTLQVERPDHCSALAWLPILLRSAESLNPSVCRARR
jgi:hypothetical protein